MAQAIGLLGRVDISLSPMGIQNAGIRVSDPAAQLLTIPHGDSKPSPTSEACV